MPEPTVTKFLKYHFQHIEQRGNIGQYGGDNGTFNLIKWSHWLGYMVNKKEYNNTDDLNLNSAHFNQVTLAPQIDVQHHL